MQLSSIWQQDKQKLSSTETQQSISLLRTPSGTYCPSLLLSGYIHCLCCVAKIFPTLYHIQTSQHTLSHSLSCFEVPHVCRGTPGLLIIALPADFSASIPRCVCSALRQVDSPDSGPQGGKYSRLGSTDGGCAKQGEDEEGAHWYKFPPWIPLWIFLSSHRDWWAAEGTNMHLLHRLQS